MVYKFLGVSQATNSKLGDQYLEVYVTYLQIEDYSRACWHVQFIMYKSTLPIYHKTRFSGASFVWTHLNTVLQ